MSSQKHFQISCPVFWGFNRCIDISNLNSVQECVDKFLDIHKEFLFEQNYIDLMNFFDAHRKEYHIHNLTLDQLKNTNDTIYVCRHPPSNNQTHQHNHNCNNCASELENNLNK